MEATLSRNLTLSRCPHCSIANPNLVRQTGLKTQDHTGTNIRTWAVYNCLRCGGVVVAWSDHDGNPVKDYFPKQKSISEDVPERPRTYLQQATESLHAPSGAVMLAASAVDAMLKLKGYTDGSLFSRIEKAAKDHVITDDMALWAHNVRLDANEQRHADENAAFPDETDASRSVEFASALAEILFVLPNRVKQGINQVQANQQGGAGAVRAIHQ